VTFPVLGKIDVNGSKADPLFEWIKREKPGFLGVKRVLWNFEKVLISSKGEVVERWRSVTTPKSIEETVLKEIEKAKKDGSLTTAAADAPAATSAPAEAAPEPTTTETAPAAEPAEVKAA
jgi:glutathione peroxidase